MMRAMGMVALLAGVAACAPYDEQGAILEAEAIAGAAADQAAAEAIAFNPLLSDTSMSDAEVAALSEAQFDEALNYAFTDIEALVDTIAAQTSPPTYENSVSPVLDSYLRIKRISDVFERYQSLQPEMAAAVEQRWEPVANAMAERISSNDVFEARFVALRDEAFGPDKTEAQRLAYEDVLRGFNLDR